MVRDSTPVQGVQHGIMTVQCPECKSEYHTVWQGSERIICGGKQRTHLSPSTLMFNPLLSKLIFHKISNYQGSETATR
jgi:hypothetical protein